MTIDALLTYAGQRMDSRQLQDAKLALNVLVRAADLLAQIGYELPNFDQGKREDSFHREFDDLMYEAMDAPEAPGSFIDNIKDNYLQYEERTLPDGMLLRHYENGNVRRINPRSELIEEEQSTGQFLISLPDGRYIFQEMPGCPLFLCEGGEPGFKQLVHTAKFQVGTEDDIPAFYFEDGASTLLIDYEQLRSFRVNMTPDQLPRRGRRKRTLSGLRELDLSVLSLFVPAPHAA